MSLTEARAWLADWHAEREARDREPYAGYFADVDAEGLIEMAETRRKPDGRKMSRREFGCFVERWCQVFGTLPPSSEDTDASEDGSPEPPPLPDTMLRMPEIERLTALSNATIKRMVKDGRFPKPMKIGLRAVGWPARDVQLFIDTLDDQRRKSRQ